jgi:hypothetical protein
MENTMAKDSTTKAQSKALRTIKRLILTID